MSDTDSPLRRAIEMERTRRASQAVRNRQMRCRTHANQTCIKNAVWQDGANGFYKEGISFDEPRKNYTVRTQGSQL